MPLGILNSIAEYFRGAVGDSEVRPAMSESELEHTAASFAAKRMALYIAVSYVSNALSMCEVKTYEGGRSVKGELYYALNVSPNPNQSAPAFMNALVERYFYDSGALMVQPFKSRNHFYIADGFGIDERPMAENEFTGVSVEGEGIARAFPASDVCYFKLENTEVMGIVSSMYRELGSLYGAAMDSYKRANGDKFTLTRGHSGGGTREDDKKAVSELNDRLRDFIRDPNGVLPLYTGQVLERVQSNGAGSSADVIALRKDIFETTANAMKIPQSMMYGNMTNTNDVINQFITFGIDPIADMIGKELTRKFYGFGEWDGGRNRIAIDTSKINHVDMFQVAEKADKLLSSGIFSIDEIRQPLGADALNEEYSRAHWVTKNYSPIQDALENVSNATSAGGGEGIEG